MAEEAGGAGGSAAVAENKEQFVPWSRFSGVINENKTLKEGQDAQATRIQELEDKIAAFQPAGAGREDAGSDIYSNPDAYVNERVDAGVNRVLADRDAKSRTEMVKANETEAVEFLQGTPEWQADPKAADREFGAILKRLRTDKHFFAEVAVELYRTEKTHGDGADEAESKDRGGNRRVSKEAVASLKGKGAGNGGFSRSQIKGMSDVEFLKNREAIHKADAAGLISED